MIVVYSLQSLKLIPFFIAYQNYNLVLVELKPINPIQQ